MFPQLPEEGLVSLFDGMLVAMLLRVAVLTFLVFAVAITVAVRAVLLVQGLGFFPRMTLAGNRGKEKSGGCSGEEGGQFHDGPDVADQPGMASGH